MVGDNLMAKALREKWLNKEVKGMIGNIDDLYEMWSTMDTCCERPENSKFGAIQPIVELKKCKMSKMRPSGSSTLCLGLLSSWQKS
jgi:hypothetical protein